MIKVSPVETGILVSLVKMDVWVNPVEMEKMVNMVKWVNLALQDERAILDNVVFLEKLVLPVHPVFPVKLLPGPLVKREKRDLTDFLVSKADKVLKVIPSSSI